MVHFIIYCHYYSQNWFSFFCLKTKVDGIYEPAYELLVLIANALSCSLNMHGQLSGGARCLNFGLRTHQDTSYDAIRRSPVPQLNERPSYFY